MKKLWKYAFIFCLMASGALLTTACGDDDDADEDGPGGEITNPKDPETNEAMTSGEQKEYLETVALEFMEQTPSSDFDYIGKLAKHISDTYDDDYDWDAVGDWWDDIYKSVRTATGTTTTEKDSWSDYWDGHNFTITYNYIYTNYTALIVASNFKGHFTAANGKWTKANADDLQFIFKDQNGKECVLKVETSGKEKKVHCFDLDEYDHYDSNNDEYDYVSNEYYDHTQYTIGVPEKIVVTLTQGGNEIVKNTTTINLGNITNETFDISKNSISLTNVTELNNGYKFNLSQCAYTGNTSASVTFAMSKDGKSLASVAVSGDLSGIPSCNVNAFSDDDFDEDDYNTDDATAKNAYMKIDILGKVQIQGKISDVRKFADYLDKADENDNNEANYKSYVNQANGLTDISLFYNGNSTREAKITLEAFADETWGGTTYWECEPVMNFYDGTSYSTFEAFFNDTDFKKTIDTFKNLAEKYADLVDE